MVQPINAFTQKVYFEEHGLKKSGSRKDAIRFMVIDSAGFAAVTGAVTTTAARNYTSSWKQAGMIGLGTGLLTMCCLGAGIKKLIKNSAGENEILGKEKSLLADVSSSLESNKTNVRNRIKASIKKVPA